jgi:hypothetical protein
VTKAASVKKGPHCWYAICNQCGDFAATASQPDALACVLEHLKLFNGAPAPAEVPPAALAQLDQARAGADATLNSVVCRTRHCLAAGVDTTAVWNETYEEWRQHTGSPMLAFAFATAVVRLAVPQG